MWGIAHELRKRPNGSLCRFASESLRVMTMHRIHLSLTCLLASAALLGCASTETLSKTVQNDTTEIDQISKAVDYPSAEIYPASHSAPPITARSVRDLASYSYRDMSLSEAMRTAMENSPVLRQLGGTVLRSPASIQTRYSQQIQNTDPRFSREAALSAFDAQLNGSAVFNKNDQIYNNSFFAGGTRGFKQDLHDYRLELSKVTAAGSQLALRSVWKYDANNAPANTFNSAWDAIYEGEIRQPLLQGGGLEFNRIAGPASSPGVYNGLLIARVNADINQADFEIGLRDFISNVENAYWDLYFAYRDVDARRKAMLKARDAWNRRKARGSETDPAELALAKEQYFRFKADLDEAVSGRLVQGTQARNGSTGGTLRGTGGLLVAERRLRLQLGLPTADGQLIRPADEPTLAEVVFDWDSIVSESMNQRAELRQQQMRVRRREMELLAAKNFLNPRLDVFGRYRFRGFGQDLIDNGPNGGNAPASALGKLATGDLQGWTAGVELSVPIGYRQAHAAVANAELQLAREKTIHQEQQREVVHDIGNAVSDVARAHQACRNNLNRYLAAEEALTALSASDEAGARVDIERILDAQRRAVEAEIRYFRSRAEYVVALKNVHFEKGSLLEFNNMRVAGNEGGSEQPIQIHSAPIDFEDSVPETGVPSPGKAQEVVPPPSPATAPDTAPDTAALRPAVNAVSKVRLVTGMPSQTPAINAGLGGKPREGVARMTGASKASR